MIYGHNTFVESTVLRISPILSRKNGGDVLKTEDIPSYYLLYLRHHGIKGKVK